MKKLLTLSSIAISVLVLSSCSELITILSNAPTISSFSYDPSNIKKGDSVSFNVVASDSLNRELSYKWTTTKGSLSTNTGKTISWKPLASDGTCEFDNDGTAKVTLIVSNGTQATEATANIFVNKGCDSASIDTKPVILPVFPSNSATTSPYVTSSPSTTSSMISDKNNNSNQEIQVSTIEPHFDVISESKIILKETFDADILEDLNWSSYRYTDFDQFQGTTLLGWKITNDNKNKVSLLTSADNTIHKGSYGRYYLISKTLDLSKTKIPKLSFYAKSDASPNDSVILSVLWKNIKDELTNFEVAFVPERQWKKFELDLSVLPDVKKVQGSIQIGAYIKNNSNSDYKGVMIDNVMVYDDSK